MKHMIVTFNGASERSDNMSFISVARYILFMDALHTFEKSSAKHNQRTNGPVNAHLRPEIYTNKLV